MDIGHQRSKRLKKIDTDAEMQLMYYLFTRKNIMPSLYYNKTPGEKVIIRAFLEKEFENIQKY